MEASSSNAHPCHQESKESCSPSLTKVDDMLFDKFKPRSEHARPLIQYSTKPALNGLEQFFDAHLSL